MTSLKNQNIFYKQCTIKRANAQSVAWIPEKFASIGKAIKIKESDEWQDGWIVEHVGPIRRSHDDVVHQERAYLRHRKFTDI